MTSLPHLPRAPRRQRRIVLGLFVAIVAANMVFRDYRWRHEWAWGLWSAGFVTVLLCPVVAGVGAVIGVGFRRRRRPAALVAGSASRAMLLDLWTVTRPALGAHLAAVAVTALIVAVSSRQWPTANGVLALPGPVLQLIAAAVVGWAVGVILGGWWSAALVAVAWFTTTLVMFLRGTMPLVRTGWASGSLLGLRISPDYVGRQWVWLAVVIVAAAMVGREAMLSARRGVVTAVVAAVAVVATAGFATAGASEPFEPHRSGLVCGREPIPVCLAPGYETLRPEVAANLAAAVRWWRDLGGAPLPTRAEQRAQPSSGTTYTISANFLRPSDIVWDLIRLMSERHRCDDHEVDSPVWRAESRLLGLAVHQLNPGRPEYTEEIASASPEEQRRMALEDLATIRRLCPGPE